MNGYNVMIGQIYFVVFLYSKLSSNIAMLYILWFNQVSHLSGIKKINYIWKKLNVLFFNLCPVFLKKQNLLVILFNSMYTSTMHCMQIHCNYKKLHKYKLFSKIKFHFNSVAIISTTICISPASKISLKNTPNGS